MAFLPSPAGGAAGRITISSGGGPRAAILIQHSRLKQGRRPAVVVLRGAKKQGLHLHRIFGLAEMARSSGAILVYPEPQSGHWADVSAPEPNRDMHFVHDLIAKLINQRLANPNKIFLVGIGTGGSVALRLACEGKQKFAGVAVVAANLPPGFEASCMPPGPVPLLMIADAAETPVLSYGEADHLPQGVPEPPSIDKTLALFGKAAGCDGTAPTVVAAKEMHDGAHAYIDKLNHCAVPVEAIRIEGVRHPAPGLKAQTETGLSVATGPGNSARFVWDFFRRLGG